MISLGGVRGARSSPLALAVLGTASALLVSACGPAPVLVPTPTASTSAGAATPRSAFGTGGPGNPATNLDGIAAVKASLYDAGTPCAPLEPALTPLGKASPECNRIWSQFTESFIPGAAWISALPWPTKISVGPGADAAGAAVMAAAYERQQTLVRFADAQGDADLVKALEPAAAIDDVDSAVVKRGVRATFTACSFPYALRAVALDRDSTAAIQANGWAIPATTALIAYYHACPDGVRLRALDGTVTFVRQAAPSASLIIAGTVAASASFGTLWVTSGEVRCGTQAITKVCGAAAT